MSSLTSDSGLSDPADQLAKLQAEMAQLRAEAAEAKAKAAEAELARRQGKGKGQQGKGSSPEKDATNKKDAPKKDTPKPDAKERGGADKTGAKSPADDATIAYEEGAEKAGQRTADSNGAGKTRSQAGGGDAKSEPKAEGRNPGSADEAKTEKSPVKPKPRDRKAAAAVASPPRGSREAAKGQPPTKPGKPGKGGKPAVPDAEIDPEVEYRGYRYLFQALGSWTFSVIVHMVILIALALWFLPALIVPPVELEALQERPEEELTQVLDQQIDPSDEINPTSNFTPLAGGHQGAIATQTEPQFEEAVSDTGPQVKVGEMLSIGSVGRGVMMTDVPEGAPGDPQAVVDSIDEAMDRITKEILLMLEKGKVLVVWVFDESESMEDDQKEIGTKIERVYKELGLRGVDDTNEALMTAVFSYGEQLHIHSKEPTNVVDSITAAIDKVPVDESGVENMCFAVGKTISLMKDYARRSRRQMAVILVTDESGDPTTNVSLLEPTIAQAKQARCRIYCLGREAVFGYPYAYMRWTDAKTKINYWLRIDRGPETPFVEQLQTNGFWRRHDAHPSGFGPYEQARMARETGAVFFMLPSPEVRLVQRDDRKYELAKMRPYLPSLDTRESYAKERSASKLRSVLWKVINDLNPWNEELARHINMREEFSSDEAAFRQQAAHEMQKAMRYVLYLDAAEKALEELAAERERETYPRWQANYDLIFAQVLAYKVRIYQYGAYLQWWLDNPDKRPKPSLKPPNNRQTVWSWDIRSRQEVLPTEKFPQEQQDAYIARSSQMLRDVIANHEGTPWAARAQWELARGFGVHLVQEWDNPNRGKGVKLPKY